MENTANEAAAKIPKTPAHHIGMERSGIDASGTRSDRPQSEASFNATAKLAKDIGMAKYIACMFRMT
jgi:hypothetical protein